MPKRISDVTFYFKPAPYYDSGIIASREVDNIPITNKIHYQDINAIVCKSSCKEVKTIIWNPWGLKPGR